MLATLTRNWWMVALRGVAAIVFGVTAIVWPDITLGALIVCFGAFAIVDGTFAIASSFSSPSSDRWWQVFGGLAGIAVGITTWAWPGLTALALLYFIASWAIIEGAVEIASAFALREVLTAEWLLVISGIISILFGIVLFAFPGDGAIAVVTTIGIFSIIGGGSLLGFAWRLRGIDSGRTVSGAGLRPATGH